MAEKARGTSKTRVGVVVSNKMDKTATVKVERRVPHPVFRKIITRSKSYAVHDEKNELNPGDTVKIVETRPLSKRKRWRLGEIIKKAQV